MTKKRKTRLAPKKIGVKQIPTASLKPNPHNPRTLFDPRPLKTLKASISKLGILVPLTVYWSPAEKTYVILDGERRWICANELGLKKVPANQVAEPSLVENIVTMFQIHKLRADWELMPTALKLEVLMKEFDEKGEKKLAELTGLDQAVVSRCKKLLSYPRRFQDLMLDPNPANRVKADFFIELYAVRNDRFVNTMKWFTKDRFTRRMLAKYRNRTGIKAVTDFRTMKQHINNARRANKKRTITRKLREFTAKDSLTLDHLMIPSADISAFTRKLLARFTKIEGEINGINVEECYGQEELWNTLQRLLTVIRKKLTAAGRRIKP